MVSFSPARFAYTVRYLGFVKWRKYVNWVLVSFFVSCAIALFFKHIVMPDGGFSAVYIKPAFCFAMTFCASFCCVHVLYPSGRPGDEYTQFLTLPASPLEKFVAALLMRVGMALFCALVGYYASVIVTSPSEFLRVLAAPAISVNGVTLANAVPDSVPASLRVGFLLLPYLALFCSLSFFVFAGFLFSRFKWILGAVVQVLLVTLALRGVASIDDAIDFEEYDINYTALIWWIDFLLFATFSLLMFASYRLWRRSQAVFGRFFSVW